MGSAKVTIAQQDRSAIVTSLSGISVGTVVNSIWGPTEPFLVTNPTKLINTFGKPDNKKGTSLNGAELLSADSSSLWVTRAIHDDARYACALVSGETEGVDYNEFPKPDEMPDPIVKSVKGGLGLSDLDSYTFPNYVRDREFIDTKLKVNNFYEHVETIEVSGFSFKDGEDTIELGVGDTVAFGESANDESAIYEIKKAEKVKAREDVIYSSAKLTGDKGDEILKWVTPVLVKSTIHNVKVAVNTPVEFNVTVDANTNTLSDLTLGFTFTNPTQVTKFEYKNGGSSWTVLKDYTIKGIEVNKESSTTTYTFRATFAQAGENTVRVWLRQSDNTPVSESNYRLNVGESGPGTTGGVISESADGTASYTPPVYLIDNVENSESIKVTDSDSVLNGDTILVKGQDDVKVVVKRKEYLIRDSYELTFTTPVESVEDNEKIQWMKYGNTEQRDLFLVYAKYPGAYGNRIKIGIRHSKDYKNAFWVDEYFDGVLMGSYEVTRKKSLDGYGYQMYIEDKINGVSDYIMVKNNELIDSDVIPAETNYAVYRQLPVDIFSATLFQTIEDVVTEDTEITLNTTVGLKLGDRIKFGPEGKYEYKVTEIVSNHIVIDRGIEEIGTIDLGTVIYKFDPELNDEDKGVFNGSQYFKYVKLPALANYRIGDQYKLDDEFGVILDAGYNNTLGGFDGSSITVYDVINAFKKMSNKESYKISIFCDNGFAYPEVAIALDEICQARGSSHAFLSTSFDSELKSDAVSAIIDYRNSTNLNTAYSSLFCTWVKVSDTYNQTNVWVAPSVFGVNTQSFVTRNYTAYTPAAGWVYGVLSGLDVTNKFDVGERDALIDAQVNVIRYREGKGLAMWGNETLYSMPSPLQLRSVAMLLIILKDGFEDFLENRLFFFNNESTWSEVEGALDLFVRDTLYLPGGLYAYQIKVKDIITDTDINNRRMPVFCGIQPTMDIKEIPVTIGIFNKSVDISY